MRLNTNWFSATDLDILQRAFAFEKKFYNDKLREEYKRYLVGYRKMQLERRSPDYDDGFDWNTPCGIEDMKADAEYNATLDLLALRLAYQLRRGLGSMLKKYTNRIFEIH